MNGTSINLYIFTQNLVPDSLKSIVKKTVKSDSSVFLTTHFLFENERETLEGIFPDCTFLTFADLLTDEEMQRCDEEAYIPEDRDFGNYESRLKELKNRTVAGNLLKRYKNGFAHRYIFCDDLGLDLKVWEEQGCEFIEGSYYYTAKRSYKAEIRGALAKIKPLKKVYKAIVKKPLYDPAEVFTSEYEGRKYVFIGKMSRIGYRLDIPFTQSAEECERLNAGCYEPRDKCVYLTTWHEAPKCFVPDDPQYLVYWMQDGYIPPNYSDYDYFFKPDNVVYYCWDTLGTKLFENRGLPYEVIPFRKKLYLEPPVFPDEVKNVLVVASGSGDWTAMKNRSDDDIMVWAFAQTAKRFPDIHFTYRCHPTWVHPSNVGVNAINRVNDYFTSLGLDNLTLSSNIPPANTEKGFQFSFSRSSLDEDLAKADIVFGEHSISMIDAAFRKIPFSSVNLTNRRNFFVGINDLGFPTCSTLDGIAAFIGGITREEFRERYSEAVVNYNRMTDEQKSV